MNWQVVFTQKAAKQADRLNTAVLSTLRLLVEDLIILGPSVGNTWPNYGKLNGKKYALYNSRTKSIRHSQEIY